MTDENLIFVLLVAAATSVAISGVVLRAALRGRAMPVETLEWPDVSGWVTVSEVTEGRRAHNNSSWTVYHPRVAFTYTVGDRSYTGNRLRTGSWKSFNSRERAREVLQRYPVGAEVQVFYDPERPDHAVLEPGGTVSSWLLLASGSLFALLGIAAISGAVGALLAD